MRNVFDKYGPRFLLFALFIGVGVFMWAILQRQVGIDTKKAATIAAKVEKHDHAASTKSQIASCKRGNALRHKINGQGDIFYGIIKQVVASAEKRAKLETGEKKALDLKNARIYQGYLSRFREVPIIHCAVVIKKVANSPTEFPTTATERNAFAFGVLGPLSEAGLEARGIVIQ